MALIDPHGRVFGRFNLLDALLVALLIAVLPIAYAARVLFRDPPAMLAAISPRAVSQGSNAMVELTGNHFRPYMRVSFGVVQAASFHYYGPTQAFAPLPPELEPGTYDVVLFDYAREVARVPQALVVTGPPRPAYIRLQVSGAFTAMTPELAKKIVVGIPVDAPQGTVLVVTQVGEPRPAIARVRVSDELTASTPVPGLVDVPATVVLSCPTIVVPDGTIRCATGGVVVAPDVHLTVQGPAGRQLFRVERIEAVLPSEGLK